MTTNLTIFLFFLLAHHYGDFVFQSHWMASNKAKNPVALFLHAATYTFTIWAILSLSYLAFSWKGVPFFNDYGTLCWIVFLTGIQHLCVDALSSRVTAELWKEQKWHEFFVNINLDQLLHYAMFILTCMLCGSL